MSKDHLSNPPLKEVIFELRWPLEKNSLGLQSDPNRRLIVGRMYDRVKDKYPEYEELPQAQIGVDLPQVVMYRYRAKKGGYPLIQIGPGICTLNDARKEYSWKDFKKRIDETLDYLYSIAPDIQKKKPEILLRYINRLEFDFRDDVAKFVKEQLGISIGVKGFADVGLEDVLTAIDIRFTKSCKEYPGVMHIRIARASDIKTKKDFIHLEYVMVFHPKKSLKPPATLKMLESGHRIIDKMFFGMLSDDLRGKFE